MHFKTRDVTAADIDALALIYAEAYTSEQTGEHWSKQVAQDVVTYWFKRSPDGLKVLAHDDEKILGAFFADVKPWWDGPRMIDGEFFVKPSLQGKGIGTALLKAVMTQAKERYKATCFETITFQPETEYPLKWYKKIGFEQVENLTVINGSLDEVLKRLG